MSGYSLAVDPPCCAGTDYGRCIDVQPGPRTLLDQARGALADGRHEEAYDLACRALGLVAPAGAGEVHPHEYLCRGLMARCLETKGDTLGALRLHRENARRGSNLEETYQRLAYLGEKHGDLEAVRTGCDWLQDVAHQFGLIDLRARRRLERVERAAAQGTLGAGVTPTPRSATDPGAPAALEARPDQPSGCLVGLLVPVIAIAITWLVARS